MSNTILSLLPPMLIIIMVIVTRKVILSLGVGILAGAFVVTNFNPTEAIIKIGEIIKNLFIEDSSLNTGNIYILLFLLLLGLLTGFINILGGNIAFGRLVKKKIHSKRSAMVTTAAMGLTIFPDDVFNMFAIGQIARPIADAHRFSRQKLAYILHTIADSLCVLFPISSWGAYIISILAIIFTTNALPNNAFVSFVQIAPMNFYALTSILMIFTVTYLNINIGKMKQAEGLAQTKKEKLLNETNQDASIWDLILPIGTLIIVVLASILITGYRNSSVPTLITIFENAEVSISLIIGSISAIFITGCFFLRNVFIRKNTALSSSIQAIKTGIRTTIPAIVILLCAWMVSDLTNQLETGYYLASITSHFSLPVTLLPFIMFLLTGIMAFSTGTSWGTFAIMLPIAAQIALSQTTSTTIEEIMFPMMAAVLAGSLFGDHCSPISDTTTVASAAAGCNQFEHFQTQLPYALTAAGITAMAFLLFGITSSYVITYAFIISCISGFVFFYKRSNKSSSNNQNTLAHQ